MDYKAFVSSTFLDLKDHRAHVIRQLRIAGFYVDPMEDWTSSTDEPKDFSTQRLEGCHLCILLIARRRGYVPLGKSLSITQMEYEEANKRGIDILPYVLDDDVPANVWTWEERDEVNRWRAEVVENRGVEKFKKTPTTIAIAPALTRRVTEQGPKTALRLYLEGIRREHGVIRFVSMPRLEDNADAPIEQLYIEPAVADRAVSADTDTTEWPDSNPVLDVLARHEYLVLLGDPGSGKSTLTSWLAWQLAEHHQRGGNPWTERLGQLIPLPMILREMRIGPRFTWESLLEEFVCTPIGRLLTMANIESALTNGKAMIILDGLDEIGSPRVRRDLRNAIWTGMQKHSGCRYLLTSRVVGYEEVEFHHEARALANTHFGLPRGVRFVQRAVLRFVVPFSDRRVEQFAHHWFALRENTEDKSRRQANELLSAIRSNEATTKLGRIPNLLTMMALIYRVRARLPHGRALLYSEISQAYLETIDFYRRIQTRTEPLADKKRWLSRIGFEMQKKRVNRPDALADEIFASGDEVRGWIAAAMSDEGKTDVEIDAADFVDYLARRSGLLLPRGRNQFAFLHLSFQEYFAACFLQNQIASPTWLAGGKGLAEGARNEDVRQYAGQSVWRETLVFLVELVAASDLPAWLDPIFECLFGQDFTGIDMKDEDNSHNQAVLLSRLVIDPHAGFTQDFRQNAIEFCCAREVHLMNDGHNGFGLRLLYSNEALRVLLGTNPNERNTIVGILCDQVRKREASYLDLSNTLVSDVASLADLPSLQCLYLNNTSVLDLTPLGGLTGLKRLYLDNTGVSDLTPIARLANLEHVNVVGTAVRDLSSLVR